MGDDEPTWLKLAQGLLLSPPSLYGDRWTIGHLRLGERVIQALFLSLGVREYHSVLSRLLLWLTRPLGRMQPLFPLGATQTAQVYIGTKFGFRLGIFNLVWISLLSTLRNICLSECFGAHRCLDVGIEKRRKAVSFRLFRFVSVRFVGRFHPGIGHEGP